MAADKNSADMNSAVHTPADQTSINQTSVNETSVNQVSADSRIRPDVLRVLTWNVKDLSGDVAAVERVITAAQPDVVCLQEAPRRLASRNRLVALAADCGLYFVDGGRASAGTAILTSLRTDVDSVRAQRLPVANWRTRPRGFVRALLSLPGTAPVSVTVLHLGLNEAERAQHVNRMLAGLTDDVPAILAGDLNEKPGQPSWRSLTDWAGDPDPHAPLTFPALKPRERIDVVLVDPRLEVLGYGDPEGLVTADVQAGSDHRPVLAQVRLLPAATA